MHQSSHGICDLVLKSLPLTVKNALVAIVEEYDRAKKKHPEWPDDLIHRTAVVAEESGELTRAALLYKYENGEYFEMFREAKHTGATALRFMIELPVINEE